MFASASYKTSSSDPVRGCGVRLASLLLSNAILASAMPMLIVLGGLGGLSIAPAPQLATLPAAMQMMAGLFFAAPCSLLMGRFSRRVGFVAGAAIAFVGGVIGAAALIEGSFALLCVAHVLFGPALTAFQYFRFAAGESVHPRQAPMAISLMLGSGLIAALLGSEVFLRTRDMLAPIPLAGAYAAICPLMVFGCLPLIFSKMAERSVPVSRAPLRHMAVSLRIPSVGPAILAGAVSQGVMVLLMSATPLAMVGCGFSHAEANDVIRVHVVAMFAPSFITGPLIAGFGARRVVLVGLGLLAMSCLLAAGGQSVTHFYAALILLGIGWNFGFVSATAIINTEVDHTEGPSVQGANETLIALAASIAALLSGAVVATIGWTILALAALPFIGIAALVVAVSASPTRSY